MKEELERVREWAQERLQGGSEPPWAWYRYMQLVEATTAILDGMEATQTTTNGQFRIVSSLTQPKPPQMPI